MPGTFLGSDDVVVSKTAMLWGLGSRCGGRIQIKLRHKIISGKYYEENNAGWHNKIMGGGVKGVTQDRLHTVTYLSRPEWRCINYEKKYGKRTPPAESPAGTKSFKWE